MSHPHDVFDFVFKLFSTVGRCIHFHCNVQTTKKVHLIFLLKMVVSNFCFGLNSRTYGDYGVPSLFHVQLLFLFDATFSIVPAPFEQCLIAMVFELLSKSMSLWHGFL
jgi:hypothetical protein